MNEMEHHVATRSYIRHQQTVAFRSFFNVIELMKLLIRGGQVDLSILLNGVGER